MGFKREGQQSGVCCRDIKVENLFLTQDGELKLGDFGLALNVALERPTARVGTLDYMSPEVSILRPAQQHENAM